MLVWRRAERVGVVLEGSDWSTAILPGDCVIGLALLSYCMHVWLVARTRFRAEVTAIYPYNSWHYIRCVLGIPYVVTSANPLERHYHCKKINF